MFKSERASVAECAIPEMKKKKTELGPFLSDGSTVEGGRRDKRVDPVPESCCPRSSQKESEIEGDE